MANIQFERFGSTFTILNPFNGFAEEEHRVEVRKDPLLRDTSVYNPFLKDKAKAFFGQNDQELLARLAEDPAGSCIFCGENVMARTARYPDGLVPGGRVRQGEAVLFANLFSVGACHPVIALSKSHFLGLADRGNAARNAKGDVQQPRDAAHPGTAARAAGAAPPARWAASTFRDCRRLGWCWR